MHLAYIVAAIIIVFLIGLLCGLLPLIKRDKLQHHKNLSYFESFATGVFLAVGLVHMLPKAISIYSAAFPTMHYPLAALIAGVVFLIMLLLEHIAINVERRTQSMTASNSIQFVMLGIFAVHSLLMGITLGVSPNLAAGIIVFIAIMAHKGSASFALAVNLGKSQLSNAASITGFSFFLISTPLGIIIGEDLQHYLTGISADIVKATFFSIGAGMFTYMGTLHDLRRIPMVEHCCNLREYFIMLTGFAIMAVVPVLLG